MENYSIPTYEQETVINYERTNETMTVYTSDTTVMTRLDKCCREAPENYQCVDIGTVNNRVVDKKYKIKDKNLLTFRLRRVKMELTEEERQRRAERFRK